MKVTQHGSNLWQLTRLWAFNCFLVRDGDGLLLVDTGLSGSAAAIQQTAVEIGLPITAILITHAHGDHVASLDALAALLPTATVAVHARTAPFLRGEMALLPDEPQAKLRGGYVTATTEPARLLAPGDTVGPLQVVATPGHTPDHIAFWDERDGTLLAGDAFQTRGGIAVSGQLRWRFPFPALATWHHPTALASAKALRDLAPRRLAVGHGPVLENPDSAMRKAIATAERKIDGQAAVA